MSQRTYSPEEIAARGEALYAETIRDTLNADDVGKFVVIDIETGDYEIDDDDLTATERVLARRPNALTYGLRIGYPAAYRLGRGSSGGWR